MAPDDVCPPLIPAGDETPVAEDAAFEAAFVSALKPVADHLGYSVTTSPLTRSVEWGLIWRADFLIQGRPSPGAGLVNRALAWRPPAATPTATIEGLVTAFAQPIAPL